MIRNVLFYLMIVLPFLAKAQSKAYDIFKEKYLRKPILCHNTFIDGKEVNICLAQKGESRESPLSIVMPNVYLYKMSKFASAWQTQKELQLVGEEIEESYHGEYVDFYDNSKIKEIQKDKMLFYMYKSVPGGNACPNCATLSFCLISLNDFSSYRLDFEGEEAENGQVIGDFINISTFNGSSDILAALEAEIEIADVIYKPTEEDLDMENPKNFDKKWILENPNIPNFYSDSYIPEFTLNFSYLTDNILPEGDEMGSVETVESSLFKVIALFRGNVLAYDKSRHVYFAVWVESCAHGCNKGIEMISGNVLKMTMSEIDDNTGIYINLRTGLCKPIK